MYFSCITNVATQRNLYLVIFVSLGQIFGSEGERIMTGMLHSSLLFTKDDGMSMEFNVRLREGEDRDKIIAMIEHGGGLIQRDRGLDVIQLVEPEYEVLNFQENEIVVNMQYIFDCVKQNKLMDITKYAVKHEPYAVIDISRHNDDDDINSDPKSDNDVSISNRLRIKCKNSDQDVYSPRTSTNYSIADDKKIIQFLFKNHEKFCNKSKVFIYEQLLKHNIVNYSIKTHYARMFEIFQRIAVYNLRPSEEKLLRKMLSFNVMYSHKEELKMINYIVKNGLHEAVKTHEPYKEMLKKGIVHQSVKSMYQHFNHNIVPNLHMYDLPDHDVQRLMNAIYPPECSSWKDNTESKNGNDASGSERSTLSERDFMEVGISSSRKKSKQSGSKNSKANCDIAGKLESYFTKTHFTSEPRFCQKRKHSKKHSSSDFDDHTNDLSSDEGGHRISKRKKSSSHFIQNNVTHARNQHAALSKQNFKRYTYSNSVIAEKVASILQKLSAGFNHAKEANSSPHASDRASVSVNRIKEEGRCNKPDQVVEEMIVSHEDSTQANTQQSYMLGKYSQAFLDTFDIAVPESNNLSTYGSTAELIIPDQLMVKDSLMETPTRQTDTFDLLNSVLVSDNQTELHAPSNQLNVSQPIIQNSDAYLLNESDQNGEDSPMNSNTLVENVQVSETRQSNGEEEEADIKDIQIVDSPEELINPTSQAVSGMLSSEECEAFEVTDGQSLKEDFFEEIISVSKKMEGIIMHINGNHDSKNDLQNITNELFSLIYKQRFKCSIRSITKQDKLSSIDKAVLLKYIAYTKASRPCT